MTGTPPANRPETHVSLWREHARAFVQSPTAVVGLVVLVLVVLLAIFGPFIVPQNPYDLAQLDMMDGMLPPGSEMGAGFTAWLGTDEQGRDLLSGIVYGMRISLFIGVTSVVIAFLIGSSIGVLAAYRGGWVDTLLMRIVDLQLSFPAILVALVMLSIFGAGVDKVLIALVMVQWAYYARTVRGSALVEMEREYVQAADSLALPAWRVVFLHVLPNCMTPLIVVSTVQIANAIALEATLSFLGVGVPVTEPSLGMLISKGFQYIMSGSYWISTLPGVAIVVIIMAINLVGDRLREILDPRSAR
ncbi:MAG: ABC transporter permease [Mesorhizobium sp.]